MTDLEISITLALAIGWTRNKVKIDGGFVHLDISPEYRASCEWRPFDYRDWSVIGPIAERYDCFPYLNGMSGWNSSVEATDYPEEADTPQKAIALAVIGVKHD